ncbi:hypothetical protein ACFVDQ_38870 [Streptomyces sp. NPDC057684]|uniref:hypothetical protein n=1 Tax=unclassified Streptomyces TaxID=2593676 RepID=UPI0036C88F00
MTAHVDTVPWARVPKRDDDALRRAQDLWLPAARQRGIVTPDGACLTSAGLSRGRLRVAPTTGTDRSRLADPSDGIEFLTRAAGQGQRSRPTVRAAPPQDNARPQVTRGKPTRTWR